MWNTLGRNTLRATSLDNHIKAEACEVVAANDGVLEADCKVLKSETQLTEERVSKFASRRDLLAKDGSSRSSNCASPPLPRRRTDHLLSTLRHLFLLQVASARLFFLIPFDGRVGLRGAEVRSHPMPSSSTSAPAWQVQKSSAISFSASETVAESCIALSISTSIHHHHHQTRAARQHHCSFLESNNSRAVNRCSDAVTVARPTHLEARSLTLRTSDHRPGLGLSFHCPSHSPTRTHTPSLRALSPRRGAW